MAFKIPSLADISERTRQAFKSAMPSTDPWLFPSTTYVASKVIAGRIWEALLRIDYVAKQATPLTAIGEWLDRHAQSFGLTRRAATRARGVAGAISAVPGTVIPAGTALQRSDGVTYVTLTDATVDPSGNLSVEIEAQEPGYEGNFEPGGSILFSSAVTGAPDALSISALNPVSGGRSIETDDELRARLLQRLQYPPHAGTVHDYERWAKEVPGVTRVYVAPKAYGPGTVGVFFLMDGSQENGIPSESDVEAVQSVLDSYAPAGVSVIAVAPVPEPLRVEITGLEPFTPKVVENVKAELAAMIKAKTGVSTVKKPAFIRQSWIWQAVSNATGEKYHKIVLPTDDVPATFGHLLVYDERFVKVSK